jgi:hypothetical protein
LPRVRLGVGELCSTLEDLAVGSVMEDLAFGSVMEDLAFGSGAPSFVRSR